MTPPWKLWILALTCKQPNVCQLLMSLLDCCWPMGIPWHSPVLCLPRPAPVQASTSMTTPRCGTRATLGLRSCCAPARCAGAPWGPPGQPWMRHAMWCWARWRTRGTPQTPVPLCAPDPDVIMSCMQERAPCPVQAGGLHAALPPPAGLCSMLCVLAASGGVAGGGGVPCGMPGLPASSTSCGTGSGEAGGEPHVLMQGCMLNVRLLLTPVGLAATEGQDFIRACTQVHYRMPEAALHRVLPVLCRTS